MNKLQEEMLATLKSGLNLFADAMMTTQNFKDGKNHGASGYGARAGNDLIEFVPRLLKTATLLKDEVGFKFSLLNLNGNWDYAGNSTGRLVNIFHIPSTGYISIKVPNTSGGVNTFFGGEVDKVFLLSGLNSIGTYIILRVEPKGSNGLSIDGYSKEFGAESYTYVRA